MYERGFVWRRGGWLWNGAQSQVEKVLRKTVWAGLVSPVRGRKELDER